MILSTIVPTRKICFHVLFRRQQFNQQPQKSRFTRNVHNVPDLFERNIPKTKHEFENFQFKPSHQPDDARLLRVSIVGCPNAGKSTMLNQLINWKVSAVSSKVHTTRKNVIGVLVEDDIQIEFFDTPGLVSRKHMLRHKLELSFVNDLKYSLDKSDLITILVDASNRREISKLNPGILDLLQQYADKESILVLNKVDKIKDKRSLLDIVANLSCGLVGGKTIRTVDETSSDSKLIKMEIQHGKFDSLFQRTERKHYCNYSDKESKPKPEKNGWPNFAQVFMISALHNDGIDELRNFYFEKAPPKPWIYDAGVVTIQDPQKIIIDSIREVCLEHFNQEIPYNFQFKIVMWEVDDIGNLFLVVDILCPEKFLSILIGPKGSNISKIVQKSRESISDTFRCDVSLKIAAKSSFR